MKDMYKPRGYDLRGRYRNTIKSGALTTVAAYTTTAGHVFAWRWDDATVTGLIGFVRYVGVKFILTTAFGTDQEVAFGLRAARAYTASHTGGAAIDVGGTITGTGKRRTGQPPSLLTSCRMGTTDALTAGTHVIDANPLSVASFFAETVGDEMPSWESGGGFATLWDSRLSGDHLEFDNDEGFIISNEVLMGATGVGSLYVCVEWDEGILNGQ